MELRDYQIKAIERVRDSYRIGKRAPLLVMPTGSGKTLTFCFIIKSASAKGKRCLVLVHRTELMIQTSKTLKRYDVDHGLIAPKYHGELQNVAVASVQTLARRLKKTPLDFDLIIVDEAHLYMAKTFLGVVSSFPRAKILAVTATPVRLDGQGLGVTSGGFVDELILGPTTAELISLGHLAPPKVLAPPVQFSLEGVHKRGGDFVASEVSERVNKPTITGSAVDHYERLAPGESAIVFCSSRRHAEDVAAEFRSRGFRFDVVHGELDKTTREERLEKLKTGELQGVTSVDLLTTGTDIPNVSVGIMLRPTSSLSQYLQMIGRILRTAPGKKRALILDHVGNTLRFGPPDLDFEWSLDGKPKKKTNREDIPTVIQCMKCYAVFNTGRICPECGEMKTLKQRVPEEREGELKEISKAEFEKLKTERRREIGRAKTLEELKEIARERGYHPKWAEHRFNSRRR